MPAARNASSLFSKPSGLSTLERSYFCSLSYLFWTFSFAAHTQYVHAPVPRVISSQRDLINVFRCRWESFMNIPHKPDSQYPWAILHITEKIQAEKKEKEWNATQEEVIFYLEPQGFLYQGISECNLPLTSELPKSIFFPQYWFPIGKYLIEKCVT